MICPARRVSRALAANGTPAFRYDFTHVVAACPTLGAFHFEEVLFVFGNTIPSPCGGPDLALFANEIPLSKAMMGYWGSMASAGDPNGGGRFAWPMYDTTTEPEIVLDLTQSTEAQLEKPQCDFWDALIASPADAGSDAAPGDAAGD